MFEHVRKRNEIEAVLHGGIEILKEWDSLNPAGSAEFTIGVSRLDADAFAAIG